MKNKKGFTITELLAVIAIVAILSIAAMSGYTTMANNSKKKVLEQKVSQIELAAEKYAKDNNISSDQTISINKLILMGYLQPDSTTSDGLALLNNPVNNDNLVCNMVTITINNDGYKASFVEKGKDCNIAREEIVDSNIAIKVLKFHATSNRVVEAIEHSNEYPWVNDDILIHVNSSYENSARSITYEYGGNVITKDIVATNKAKNPSTESNYKDTNYNELLVSDVGLIFNGPVNITYNMKNGQAKTVKIIIKIDKEPPTGYSTMANNTSSNSTKKVMLYFDDGTGSGVDGYYYSVESDSFTTFLDYETPEAKQEGNPEKYTYNHEKKSGTMTVYKGKYYIKVFDHVGNMSNPIPIDVNNFDINDLSCSIHVYNTSKTKIIDRQLKWYNSDIILIAETDRAAGDYGAKYNFIKNKTKLGESDLTLITKPNEIMHAEIRENNEMNQISYAAAVKGASTKNNMLFDCANIAGIDKTIPTSKIEVENATSWGKRHKVTVTLTDDRSGFHDQNEDGKINFKYGWSESNTEAPTTWKTGKAVLDGEKKAEVTLNEGSGMSGRYYFWILGSSVQDKAQNKLKDNVYSDLVWFDNTDPECTDGGDNSIWRQDPVSIVWGCDDKHSGCTSESSGGRKKYTTTKQTDTIDAYNIEDNVGNKTSCPARTADIYVDKTLPTCDIDVKRASGTNEVKIKITTNDEHSKVKEFGIGSYDNVDIKEHTSESYSGNVRDNALNTNTCSANIYKLTYENEGGSGCSHRYSKSGKTWGDGEELCVPTNGTKTFKGWYTAKNGGGTLVNKDTTVSRNLTVYAKWNAKVTVNLNAGTLVTSGGEIGTSHVYEADNSAKVTFKMRSYSNSQYGIGNKDKITVSCDGGAAVETRGDISMNSGHTYTEMSITLNNVNNDQTCNVGLQQCTWWKNNTSDKDDFHYYFYFDGMWSGKKDTEKGTCVCGIKGWWSQGGSLILTQNKFIFKKLSFTTSEDYNDRAWESGKCSSHYINKRG